VAQLFSLGIIHTSQKIHTMKKIVSILSGCLVTLAAVAADSVAIEPGVAVGSVHSGMTIQQVITQLGQPDQTNDSALVYSRLGLQVAAGKGDVVHRVTMEHPFAGHTKEGIGIGSSRADVIGAFGEPTVAKPGTSGYEFLRYKKLGLVFQLHDGKIDMFSVFFQATK
jgi:hypothetical protein